MHHSREPSQDFDELRRHIEEMEGKLGATKRFPEGKITENDEGEIRFAVFVHEGKVVIDFNQPTAWLGMSGEQSVELGRLLIKRGKAAQRS